MALCNGNKYRYWHFRCPLKTWPIACGVCFGLERKGCCFCKLSPKFEPCGCLVVTFNSLRAPQRLFTFFWLILFSYQVVHVRVSLSLSTLFILCAFLLLPAVLLRPHSVCQVQPAPLFTCASVMGWVPCSFVSIAMKLVWKCASCSVVCLAENLALAFIFLNIQAYCNSL